MFTVDKILIFAVNLVLILALFVDNSVYCG